MEQIPQIPEIIFLGLPASVVIIGVVSVLKNSFEIKPRWLPLISVCLGIVAGCVGFIFTNDFSYLFTGLVTGLVASGLFSFGNKTILNNQKDK